MPPPELRRSLGLLDATLINIGTIVGSGIFITPSAIARDIEAPSLHFAVWVVGGLFSVLGALVISELGAMMPTTGGIYVYLERVFGPLWGFLYGWTLFTAIQGGAIAAVAVATATYIGWFVPLSPMGVKLTAVASIAGLTWINTRGVGHGALTQNVLTMAKLAAILVLVALALPAGSRDNLAPPEEAAGMPALGTLGLAMLGALWCYDGWIHVSYIAGEVKDPGRIVPRSTIVSTFVVIAVYLALNATYLGVLGVKGMAASDMVASETARAALGAAGGGFVAALVAVSTLGANNGFILAGARVYYAMAKDGLFFKRIASVDPDRAVPTASLIAQMIWSSLLVFTGRYDQIFTYVIFVEFAFYGVCALAVMLLRRREPDAPRPYRVWGYPFTPIAFVLFAAVLTINTIWSAPREAAIGTVLTLAGVPAFLIWDRRRKREATAGTA